MKSSCRWTTYCGEKHMKLKPVEFYLMKGKTKGKWQLRTSKEQAHVEVYVLLPKRKHAAW